MIQTEQIKEFYGVLNALYDDGVIIKFSPDMSKIIVNCQSFKFVVDFTFNSFDYKILSDYIKSKVDLLKSGVSIKTLMSEFHGVVCDSDERLNSKKMARKLMIEKYDYYKFLKDLSLLPDSCSTQPLYFDGYDF